MAYYKKRIYFFQISIKQIYAPFEVRNLSNYINMAPVNTYNSQGYYGLCDISGNIYHFCRDYFLNSLLEYYLFDEQKCIENIINPVNLKPDQDGKIVLHGGSFIEVCRNRNIENLKCSHLIQMKKDDTCVDVGFRPVLEL